MARRLYLGKLPHDTRTEEVESYFHGFGRLVDVRVMTGFGFVEFETNGDAEEALRKVKGKPFLGSDIVVEYARETRSRRVDYEERSFAPRRRPAGVRVTVDGIGKETSWQDLKDFGRGGGSVSFADIDRYNPDRGILEYLTRDEAERAVKQLDNHELRGQLVRVSLDEDRADPDNFRRDERDRFKDRGDRYRDDRYRDDRPPRRGRSSSPPRRDDRPRSPPPRREFEERKRDDPYERRREDRRRDDRDGRYDDKPGRSNGDAGWGR